jgi:glycosyltransferase involved in cell wall biosynthesis
MTGDREAIRLLILSGYLICPPISGGAMRMINPILKLSEKGNYKATYLFQYYSDYEVKKAERFFSDYPSINVVGVCNRVRSSTREKDLQLELPLDVFNFMDINYCRELEGLLRAHHFDLIQVEHSWMSWVVPLIRKVTNGKIPVVLDMHNVEFKLFERWLQYCTGDEYENIKTRFERMHRWEQEVWGWYDASFSVSPIESEIFRESTGYSVPVWDLPTGGGTDLSRFSGRDWALQGKNEIMLYLGTMEWYPNAHGILWLLDEVMPLLKRKHPDASLHIAGYGKPFDELLSKVRHRKDVTFLGEQKDEREVLRKSRVFVVPLWIAAGARVKIPTAWAAGIPVVATTIGAEGLYCTDGENILLADEPAEFARKIAMLMDDKALAQRLSHNGRAVVEERYSLDYAASKYDQIYSSLVEGASLLTTRRHVKHSFGERERAIRQLLERKADMGNLTGLVGQAGLSKQEGSLLSIQQSLRWRMLAKFDRIADKLLPQGTRRRAIYDLGLIGRRKIIDEGWRSFFWKARLWLRRHS